MSIPRTESQHKKKQYSFSKHFKILQFFFRPTVKMNPQTNNNIFHCFYCRNRAKCFNSHLQSKDHLLRLAQEYKIKEETTDLFLSLLSERINLLIVYLKTPEGTGGNEVLLLKPCDDETRVNKDNSSDDKVYYDFVPSKPQSDPSVLTKIINSPCVSTLKNRV